MVKEGTPLCFQKLNMTKNQIVRLEIEVASKPWEKVEGLQKRLNAAAELTLSVLPETLLPVARWAQLTVLLTTDKSVQNLNRDFRAIDKPTNVLSFPQFERKDIVRMGKMNLPEGQEIYVGDLAVAYDTTRKEARAESKELLDHLTHLVIHGILHLFGFDHDTDGKAARMEKLEKEIMATLGLPDPYAVLDED